MRIEKFKNKNTEIYLEIEAIQECGSKKNLKVQEHQSDQNYFELI